jgi:hypothetical protein
MVRQLVMVALAAAAACAPGARVGEPQASQLLAARLDEEIVRRGAVPWSDRLLSWDDFAGKAPVDPGDRGAQTAYTIFHAVQCTGERFEFRVVAAMVPQDSWVVPSVRSDVALSARTLRHEQTHFDLSEVHARRLRRHFSELYSPCGRSTAELDTLAGRFMKDEAEAQQRYDSETRHGRSADPQRAWDADVARQLLSLDRFGDVKMRAPDSRSMKRIGR